MNSAVLIVVGAAFLFFGILILRNRRYGPEEGLRGPVRFTGWAAVLAGIVQAILGTALVVVGVKNVVSVKRMSGPSYAYTYVNDQGHRRLKLIIDAEDGSSCDSLGFPAWSINIPIDPSVINPPASFNIDRGVSDAYGYRFTNQVNDGIAIQTGTVFIFRIDPQRRIEGSFKVTTANGFQGKGRFQANWCSEKDEEESLKAGEEQFKRKQRAVSAAQQIAETVKPRAR